MEHLRAVIVRSHALVVILIVIVVLSCNSSANTIGTSGDGLVCCLGFGGSTTWGQTIFINNSTGDQLNNFSFWLFTFGSGSPITFAAYVMPWESGHATGAVLYSSGPITVVPGPLDAITQFTFDTGSVLLRPVGSYVMFLSTAGLQQTFGILGAVLGSPNYNGGQFASSDGDFNELTSQVWFNLSSGQDLEFQANLSTVPFVPEPTAVLLLGSGLLGLIGTVRRQTTN